MKNTGIPQDVLSGMENIFKSNPRIKKVVLFGSRAKGNYRENSDIDLAVSGCEDLLLCEELLMRLADLPTLCKFDAISYESIKNQELKAHIDRVGIELFRRRET